MRVLVVCLGNICRSPAAEAAIRAAAVDAGVTVEVDSAGTGGWHAGDPPDPRMIGAGRRHDLDISGSARQVEPADFDRYDLILAMDRQNLRALESLRPSGSRAEVRLFGDLDGSFGDVPDPYYGGEDGFDEVLRLVRRGAAALVASLSGRD